MNNFYPEWVVVAANVAIYALIAALAWVLFLVTLKCIVKNYIGALLTTANSLFLLYPLGNAYKVAAVGPEFMRFHLGDIGFPPAVALFLFVVYSLLVGREVSTDASGPTIELLMADNRRKMACAVTAFVLSLGYEWVSGSLADQLSDSTNPGIGHFDWIDVACYALGSAALYACLYGINRLLHAEQLMTLQREREEWIQMKAASKASAALQRKNYKRPRKNRGVR